ncbi:MAG: hypothetical protein H6671_00675 [Anaerolineaceae bacterium]|nr:hypothetical protein [Anaerolineaceae bacterium]
MWPLTTYDFDLQRLKRQECEKEANHARLAQELPRQHAIYDSALVWMGQGLINVGERLQQPSQQGRDEATRPRLQRQP